jgi:hypothetical protein
VTVLYVIAALVMRGLASSLPDTRSNGELVRG